MSLPGAAVRARQTSLCTSGRSQARSAVSLPLRGSHFCSNPLGNLIREPAGRRERISLVMLKASNWLIVIGGCFFILVLGVSAFWEDDIRWLHFFQAWMYVATIALALRRNRWGYFIGISAAGLWDYANLVATTFFFNGLEQLSLWMRTGHLARTDLLIAVPAWFSNLFIVAGCLWGYLLLPKK